MHLDVVMTLDAFLGLSDDNGHMPGAGAVPAHALRELLADAQFVKIRRILTDPTTGHALDLGVRRYQLTDTEPQPELPIETSTEFPAQVNRGPQRGTDTPDLPDNPPASDDPPF